MLKQTMSKQTHKTTAVFASLAMSAALLVGCANATPSQNRIGAAAVGGAVGGEAAGGGVGE